MEPRTTADIIDGLQKQIDALKGANLVVYPWKPGDRVLLPADDSGKRRVIIVPNGELAMANLFSTLGVELFEGEVPASGFIIDTRKHKAYVASPDQIKDPNALPEDFKHNQPPVLDEKGQVAAVTAGILALKKEDFAKNGYPKIAELSKVVGFDVQTPIRDVAWDTFKKSQPDWEPAVE